MAEQTKNIPFASYPSTVKVRIGDGDLGASYMEMRRQEKITADQELVKEAYKASGFPGELGSPEVAPEELDLGGDIDVGAEDTPTPKPDDGLGFLGIAQQILVGGGLDAVKNTADLVTDTGEQLRNYEIGGATVEQHLQSVDEALGTGKLFSGKTEIGIGTLDKEGGAGVQMARGLVSWLVGFAALKGGGAATVPAGIAADGLAIDRDANLSNLFNDTFPEGHPLRNPLTDALAASKDDSELEKSVKSMVEGFGMTLPFTAIQAISRSLSSFKKTRVKAKQSIKDSGGSPQREFVSASAPGTAPFKDAKLENFRQKIFNKIPDIARKNPLEMTDEELELAVKEMKKIEDEVDDFVLGKKSGGKRPKSQDDLLGEEDLLLGFAGSPTPVASQFQDILRARGELDFTSAKDLGESLKYDITRLPEADFVFDPSDNFFTTAEGLAYIKLKYAFDEATRLGFDLKEVSQAAIQGAAARFPDPEDALFMVERFLKSGPSLSGSPKPIFDIPTPKPQGPKVSATFDGKEYNITDMELRFDEVNPQKKIDKVQTKFDEITEKIKEDPAKGKNKKGRDVRTLAETELQARKELQADPEGQLKELMEKDPTTTITDKDRVKMALFQEASVRKLIELRNAFNAGDSTAVQKAFDQGIFTTDLFEQAQRFSETASRDLGSGRIAKQLKRTEGNIIVDKFAVVRKDIDPNVSPESFMRKLGSIEGATDSAIEKILSKVMGETVRLGGFDMIFEAWINSLFGVKTQVVNALGSVINMGFQVTETKMAEGIRSVKRGFGATGKGVEQGEAFEMLYGILRSAPDNIIALTKNAVNIATGREVATSRFNKLDATGVRAIRGDNVPALVAMKESGSRTGNVLYKGMDIAGHFLTSMGKGLLTIDEVFKFSAYQASKHRLAYRTAIEEGITDPVALELRIRQLVNEPSPSIKAESEEFARIATFTNQAGEVGTAFQALLKAAPAAKIVIPFFNVLNNIAKFTGTRTPLALLSKNVRADLAAGGARADMAQARLASGTMASLGFLALAMGGGMTGSEPTNKAHRESFRRKKKQPFSMEFRHEDGTRTSISYNRLEPAAFFAGIMADFVKISGELEEGEIDTFVGAYTLAVSKHFLSQTFAVGVSDFLSMGIEGDDKWLRSLGSSMLPFNGIMSDIEKTLDPDLRDTNTLDRTIFQDAFVEQYGENEGKALANSLSELTKVIGRLKSRVPEFSEDLPSRLDAFGEVITTEYGFENPIINTMNPFAMSTIVPNSLEDWITAVNANIVTPEPQIAGVMLTPEEFHDYKKLGGQAAKKALLKMIAKPNWSGPNGKLDHVKKAMMEQRFSDEYERAANKMLSESRPILDKDGTSKKYAALIKAVKKERGKKTMNGQTADDRKKLTLTPLDF